jgi:hypothetical protein
MHCASCDHLTPLGYLAGLSLLVVLAVALPRAPNQPAAPRDGPLSGMIAETGGPAAHFSDRDAGTLQQRRVLVLQMRR